MSFGSTAVSHSWPSCCQAFSTTPLRRQLSPSWILQGTLLATGPLACPAQHEEGVVVGNTVLARGHYLPSHVAAPGGFSMPVQGLQVQHLGNVLTLMNRLQVRDAGLMSRPHQSDSCPTGKQRYRAATFAATSNQRSVSTLTAMPRQGWVPVRPEVLPAIQASVVP